MASRIAVVCAGLFLVSAAAADAAYLYPWDEGNPTVVDPDDTGIETAQDILRAWHAYDGTYHYFRIDLEGQPTAGPPNGHPDIYGIYMDSKPGGGSNSVDFQYIPSSLAGIDFVTDSHYREPDGFWRNDYHTWSPYAQWFNFRPLTSDEHQESENSGATLEWKITAEDIGAEVTWWAANLTTGFPSITHDITEGTFFPEPGSGMLAMIMLGWALRKRR